HDDPGLVKRADTFDRHPHLLVCASGTVDLKTGRIRPSRTADFMTRMSAVSYDRSAMVKRWLRFLDSTFSGDRELIADVQRSVGYSLTGETSEQVVFVPNGSGANGKSVFIETLAAVAGEYAITAAADTFIDTPHK